MTQSMPAPGCAPVTLEIMRTGPLALVQDLGRPGLAHLGVTRSGAADRRSHTLANRLVANPDDRATIEVLRGGRQLMMLYPERRLFQPSEETGTMVSIYSTLREDLYVVYAGRDPDTNLPVIHAYLNPLVKWIWFGGVIVALGTLLALLPSRQPVLVLQSAAAPSSLAPAPSAAIPQAITTHGTPD